MSGDGLSAALNPATEEAFVARFGGVFEASPWLVRAAWASHPFGDVAELHAALCAALMTASPAAQLALIRQHPELAGEATRTNRLTAESSREQGTAGLAALSDQDFAAYRRLNSAYRQRFGFPFIVCVREHSAADIPALFAHRLTHTPEEERETAIGEILRIAYYRVVDRVHEEEGATWR